MLVETDVTGDVAKRTDEVAGWIAEAQATARKRTEPNIRAGAHCTDPFPCGFIEHCSAQEPQAVHPISWSIKQHLFCNFVKFLSLRDVGVVDKSLVLS